jgi:transposase
MAIKRQDKTISKVGSADGNRTGTTNTGAESEAVQHADKDNTGASEHVRRECEKESVAIEEKRKGPGRPKGIKEAKERNYYRGKERGKPLFSDRKAAQALTLVAQGIDKKVIAAQMGVKEMTFIKWCEQWEVVLGELSNIEGFRENRPVIIDAVQAAIFKSMLDPAKLEKVTLNGAAYALKQVYDMGRIERNQSTSNVNVNTTIKTVTTTESTDKP